jgi:hypothetical protein
MAFLCPLCDRPSEQRREDILPAPFPVMDPLGLAETLWRVTVRCGRENCGRLITVYTTAEGGLSDANVAKRVLEINDEPIRCKCHEPIIFGTHLSVEVVRNLRNWVIA